MATSTTRAALTKPSGAASPAEAVDVAVLNTNADIIDKFLGCILVNDGVTPSNSDLFDGAIVKEKTSGIIWEARKNGGGGFDKYYVRYPLTFHGLKLTTTVATGTTHSAPGYNAIGSCINTSAAQIVSNKFVVPVKGIYYCRLRNVWANNTTGARSMCMELNGTMLHIGSGDLDYENIVPASQFFTTQNDISFTRAFNVSDTIASGVWQNSGGDLTLNLNLIQISLIEPRV